MGDNYTATDFESGNGSININTTADSLSTSGEIKNQENHTEHQGNGNFMKIIEIIAVYLFCLLYTSPSPRDLSTSRMPSSA